MNNNLQNRLYNYQQEPPAHVWPRIDAALNTKANFPELLHDFQQQPPSRVWNKIEAALNREAEHIPATDRRPKKIFYYMAAAAVLVLIIATSIFLSDRTAEDAKISTTAPANETQNTTPATENNATEQRQQNLTRDDEKNVTVSTKVATRKSPVRTVRTSKQFETLRESTGTLVDADFIRNIEERIQHFDFSAAERYMVYVDGNGKIAKLPRKIFSMVHCSEDDFDCKSNLQSVQEKVSSASLATDFFGFLQILQQLQENQ